jgi:hypothetical protein
VTKLKAVKVGEAREESLEAVLGFSEIYLFIGP